MRKGRQTLLEIPTAPPRAQPATGMIVMPEPLRDPRRMAEEAIEKLRREQTPCCVKTSKKKKKGKDRR